MATEIAIANGKFFNKTIPSTSNGKNTQFASQMENVKKLLKEEQLMNGARLDFEVEWFYGDMGIDKYYFETHSEEEIAQDISSLYSAKCLAHVTGSDLELKLSSSRQGKATFASRSIPGSSVSPCLPIEHSIELDYLGSGYEQSGKYKVKSSSGNEKRWRVQCYRTQGTVAPDSNVHLRFYFLSEPVYPDPKVSEKETDLEKVSDKEFLRNVPGYLRKLYQDTLTQAVNQMSPVIHLIETDVKDERLLIIGYRHHTTHSYFSGITDLYHSLSLYSPKKYVDQFANGITMFSVYLRPRKDVGQSWTPENAVRIVEDANLIYILPRTSISYLFRDSVFTVKEHAYAYAGWKFAFHFLARQASEFADLAGVLKNDPVGSTLLETIKKAVRKEAYSEGRIMEAIVQFPNVVKDLYKDFAARNQPGMISESKGEELWSKIQKTVPGELDRQIFKAMLTFNKHTLKTNLYKRNKVALAFRLEPSFLSKEEYALTPFGVFFVVGPEFRGFHIRMRDIARGGIRLIKSQNVEAFIHNVSTLFQENYNLASTQDRKNKDIAEGGSKGTILLSVDHQDKPFEAFTKYIDSLMDLLLPDDSIVDHLKQQEILFMGPDENTANYMDWASDHSRTRGYKFWKAFTTGKSTDRGGIPHDLYGMTTRGIHQYVVGTLKKLNLKEEECTKFQTGGPDGDLGSNEIKISLDRTVSIVDGSGVLYDPQGIDKAKLLDLAHRRAMVKEFPKDKLSPNGFFVDVDSVDIKLPDGTLVNSGLDFRNTFHLNPLSSAKIFVPCGGRPESVNMGNIQKMFDANKKPRYEIIVEGANLFFSQEARLALEKAGVIIFKDASANKGGVTSSSLEVLAALAMADDEFAQHMKGGAAFYESYVKEVHKTIEENANLEFECMWNEHAKSGTARSILSDIISNKINDLSASISNSELWNDNHLREKVLKQACPKGLLDLVGIHNIMQRVPENYLKAMFGTYLASRYVYQNGLTSTPEFTFFSFIKSYMAV